MAYYRLSLSGDVGHVEATLRDTCPDQRRRSVWTLQCYTFWQSQDSTKQGERSMYRSVEKVVTEYIFAVGNLEFRVKGRISEKLGSGLNTPLPFSWTVSHHYRTSKDAPGVTAPVKTDCASREEAERLLFTYVRSFTDISEPNRFY